MSVQSKFTSAIAQICDEKNISQDVVIKAVEAAIAAAYRKDYGSPNQQVRVEFDDKTGFITVYRQYKVVKEVENPEAELTTSQAKKKKKGAKKDDVIEEDVTPKDFGRIAAQTAKQVIIQRIREAERESIYNTYKDREGELVNAQVQRVERNGTVFLDLDKATVVMERNYQIPKENFYNGQRVKVYIEKVEKNEKGPQIIVSRTHSGMIQRLLELDVPEILEGSVEVKCVAREPGIRTKVAVFSSVEGVDPVGACVGQKGVRIQAVTDELSNERIDIVEWSGDPVKFLVNALAPAKIISIKLDEEAKRAKVYVTEDQRSLAIGKNGQNVRLAGVLAGWEIDIEDYVTDEKESDETKTDQEGATEEVAETEDTEKTASEPKSETSDVKDTTTEPDSASDEEITKDEKVVEESSKKPDDETQETAVKSKAKESKQEPDIDKAAKSKQSKSETKTSETPDTDSTEKKTDETTDDASNEADTSSKTAIEVAPPHELAVKESESSDSAPSDSDEKAEQAEQKEESDSSEKEAA